jgi:hypothetical protein
MHHMTDSQPFLTQEVSVPATSGITPWNSTGLVPGAASIHKHAYLPRYDAGRPSWFLSWGFLCCETLSRPEPQGTACQLSTTSKPPRPHISAVKLRHVCTLYRWHAVVAEKLPICTEPHKSFVKYTGPAQDATCVAIPTHGARHGSACVTDHPKLLHDVFEATHAPLVPACTPVVCMLFDND